MRIVSALIVLACGTLVTAGPCPFHHLQDAASAGQLNAREAKIVQKMARDPSYIPALDPEAVALMKRAAAPEPKPDAQPEAKPAPEPATKPNKIADRGLLPSTLPIIGGGLLNGVLQPLSGALAGLDVPTPQQFGLREIPGTDAFGQAHQFQAPGPTDVRGGCPTLNTLANHGILSRDGITSFAAAANAVQVAYGFGYDLSVFLSALGVIAGGDLITGKYSIGGEDARVPNTIGPALGLFKHGTFEIDGSITRQDDYFGNEATFELSRWNALVAQSKQYDSGMFGRNLFAEERYTTFNTARSTNPVFNGGAKQFAVGLAERAFVYRGLPNGTTPDLANFANIAPFFLNETFPDAWFRRATPYGLVNLAPDLIDLYTGNPTPIGANEGLNNFVPGDISDFGTTPNSYLCFLLGTFFDTVPGQVQPTLLANLDLFTAFANAVVTPFFQPFGCPGLMNFTVAGNSANAAPGVSAGGSPVNGVYP